MAGKKIAITAGSLTLEIEESGATYQLRHCDAAIIANCIPTYEVLSVDGKRLRCGPSDYHKREISGAKTSETEPVTQLSVRYYGSGLPELRVTFALSTEPEYLLITKQLRQTLGSITRIGRFQPLTAIRSNHGEILLPSSRPPQQFFQFGYQSWSPTGFIRLDAKPTKPRTRSVALMSTDASVANPVPEGSHRCYWMTALSDETGASSLLVGFLQLTEQKCGVDLTFNASANTLDEVVAWSSAEKQLLSYQQTIESPGLMVMPGNDPERLFSAYVQLTKKLHKVSLAVPPPRVWCTWYAYHTRITPEKIMGNVAVLKRLFDHGEIDCILIDDGYQKNVGDWLNQSATFQTGMKELTRQIRDQEFKVGLWLAPFIAGSRSDLLKQRRSWFVTDRSNKPCYAGFNPVWKSKIYALDAANPEFIEWMTHFIRLAREDWGIEVFKLDFLYAGALEGARADNTITGNEALHRGLRAIREAAGSAYIIGCGCPLGPALGVVDAMRIGVDTERSWRHAIADRLIGLPAVPSLHNNLQGALNRSFLNREWWHNDADCLFLKSAHENHSIMLRTMATASALFGGMNSVSEDMSQPKLDVRLINLITPLPKFASRSLEGGRNPTRSWFWSTANQPGGLLTLFDLDPGPTAMLELRSLGLDLPCHVFDFWHEAYLGIVRERLGPLAICEGECRHLRITPVLGRPQVIGSTFHLSAGYSDIAERWLHTDEYDELEIECKNPGRREGRLFVAIPSGTVLKHILSDKFSFLYKIEGVDLLVMEGRYSENARIQLLF